MLKRKKVGVSTVTKTVICAHEAAAGIVKVIINDYALDQFKVKSLGSTSKPKFVGIYRTRNR